MRKVCTLALIFFTSFVIIEAQSPMPPGLYVKADDLESALAATLEERGNMGVGNVANGGDFRINLIKRTQAAGAIIHEVGTELHFIVEGAGTLVTGGVVVGEAGSRRNIEGGMARRVTVGDAVLIPVGTPHQYTEVEGSVSYLEVRFNTSDFE
ncbi:MAG: hypothetical protein RL839_05975 [Gammaproteobacteria bacterium]